MMEVTADYTKRIERAIELIEDALQNDTSPQLAELANVAFMSKFHFHRVYRLVTGETTQQTISRLKLAKAVSGLKDFEHSVTQVALDTGFGSSQALAKALKREAQTTATELRREPERLADTVALLSRPDTDENTLPAISIELVNLEPLSIVGIHTKGKYPELNHTYEQLFTAVGGPEKVKAILGVPGNQSAWLAGTENTFECGLLLHPPMKPLPSPLEEIQVQGGTYLRIRHSGSYGELDASMDRLYQQALTQEDVQLNDLPCLFHYLDDPEEVEEAFLRTDIYLPVV